MQLTPVAANSQELAKQVRDEFFPTFCGVHQQPREVVVGKAAMQYATLNVFTDSTFIDCISRISASSGETNQTGCGCRGGIAGMFLSTTKHRVTSGMCQLAIFPRLVGERRSWAVIEQTWVTDQTQAEFIVWDRSDLGILHQETHRIDFFFFLIKHVADSC